MAQEHTEHTDMKHPYVADNVRVKMQALLEGMIHSKHFDISTAFLDAYGISAIGAAAEEGELRLLVGYDLRDIPVAEDIVSFQMAEEWKKSGEDPVFRQTEDEWTTEAIKYVQLPGFKATKAARQTHSKLYVTEDFGVAGSSNLTRSGITGQRELNLLQYEPEAISKLREWFATMWEEGKEAERDDFKQRLIEWLQTTRLRRFAPFHPYAKAIFERYRHRFISLQPSAADVNLAVFQEEGRDTALSILAEHKCCIIADAVGLGKTFVALGAMQRRAKSRPRNQRKILVVCPAQLENVWGRAGRDQGIALHTESMESLGNTTGSSADSRLRDLEDYALVIVDEAHNFRNPNTNRFQSLMQVLQGGPEDKELLLLTATPINNGIGDLFSLYRLMTKDRDNFFQNTNLRIRSLREFFRQVEKMGVSTTDLLLETMLCRSRLDIRRRQEMGEVIVINDNEVRFPDRRMTALEYELASDGKVLEYGDMSAAIENLTLGAYNVEQYSNNPNAQKNQTFMRLQTLFKILLLKRLESSVVSFVSTAENLLRFSDRVVQALRQGHRLTNDEYRRMQLDFFDQLTEEDAGDSAYLQDILDRDTFDYNVERLAADVAVDHSLLQPLIDKAASLVGKHDGKIARLKEELKKHLPDQKVLIFTFYADTADYIYKELTEDKEFMEAIGKARVEKIHSKIKPANRKAQLVEDFAPVSNNRKEAPRNPVQLLISTDVLSEGQNLQDCGFLINYDLHFNPVRMIQRNGRIDRLFSMHREITIGNFFPEGGLEEQLKLVERLQKKIEAIQDNMPLDSSIIGETVRVFSLDELRRTRAGDASVIDQIDAENPINRFHDILNEVVKMLQDFGIEEVNRIPFGCQSNKRSTHRGLFLCVIAGKRDEHKHCWWLYYPLDEPMQKIFTEPQQEPSKIIDLIRSPKPPDEEMWHPDFQPREIRWDIILDAKQRCREMLIAQTRNETQGQVWAANHINKKLKSYLAMRSEAPPNDISRRLGRYSLEKYKEEAEHMLKDAQASKSASALIAWLDDKLPYMAAPTDNAETMPLEVVSYLELVPETEGAV